MEEVAKIHELGDDIDENGNLIAELAQGKPLSEAVWELDKQKQNEASPYINLNQKIEKLPKFEKNEIRKLIGEYFGNIPKEEMDDLRERGFVQFFSMSSRPLSYWESCSFHTSDGKFENFLNSKIRPAVEGMIKDLEGKK